MKLRTGIDIGGTFTDFVVSDADSGEVVLWKEETTPQEPAQAVFTGLAAIASYLDVTLDQLLADTELLVHGTTVATNLLIQRDGPRVGLLCTEGFRDVLYFRDGFKPNRFQLRMDHPEALVERRLRIGIPERINADGSVVVPLDEATVIAAARTFAEEDVQAVAISFLWSFIAPEHELRAAELLREHLPGVDVVCSHTVLPEIREWERTSAAVLSAYILPRIAAYLTGLETRLQDAGLERRPLIMQINGGCAPVAEILQRPVSILGSGPAAAPAAALYYSDLVGRDLVTIDMGGTSLDVCVIHSGRPAMSGSARVDDQPIGIQAIDVHSVGAGGGSIAWVDPGGALKVGPQSAGARPGPACYGAGGDRPTVTDANVVLGRLAPDGFLGGRRPLDLDAARKAVQRHVAEPLGLEVEEAAAGIIELINANMVSAIQTVSVARGVDPRNYSLVSGGGAGGLHCVALARALHMRRVFVPMHAGVLCAFGMTATDVRHDHVVALYRTSDTITEREIDEIFAPLRAGAERQLRNDGFSDEEISCELAVDARYHGQHSEITVPVPDAATTDRIGALLAAFHVEHERQFGYSRPDMAVEFIHWRVTGLGRQLTNDAPTYGGRSQRTEAHHIRTIYDPVSREETEVPVHRAVDLSASDEIVGPAIIASETTTVFLEPSDRLTVIGSAGWLIDVAADVASPVRQPAVSRVGENA